MTRARDAKPSPDWDNVIVDQICDWLKPLNGRANPRPVIDVQIEMVKSFPDMTLGHIPAKAAKLRLDIEKLRVEIEASPLKNLFPKPPDLDPFLGYLRHLAGFRGPDPRANQRQQLCAAVAYGLIKTFSEKKPTTSQTGNFVIIAGLIHEAVTGKGATEKAGLLRACRSFRKRRERVDA